MPKGGKWKINRQRRRKTRAGERAKQRHAKSQFVKRLNSMFAYTPAIQRGQDAAQIALQAPKED